MQSMMTLPDDMFKQELLPFLTVDDIVMLDSACMNHKYRHQLLDKITGVILRGYNESMKASLFKWLGIRRIYLTDVYLLVSSLTASSLEINYIDQFKYTQHVIMRVYISADLAEFIISHCPYLLTITITGLDHNYLSYYPQLTDDTLQSIAGHCTGLISLSLIICGKITDTGLISISEHCPNLRLLYVHNCAQLTDASIISISTHCTRLLELDLFSCDKITDVSIMSISTHCTELEKLNLSWYHHITDASIISISENCTELIELNVAYTNITDASLIAIAINCTALESLCTYQCIGISSDKLRHHFKSLSELRAALLSIYPSLPI